MSESNLFDPSAEDMQAARDWEIQTGLRSSKDRFKPDRTPRQKIELLIIEREYASSLVEQQALDEVCQNMIEASD
jgi:hypothetical protein